MTAEKKKDTRVRFTCHWCENKFRKKREEITIQVFTGRRFCSEDCANEHLRSKGFNV